MSFSLGYLLCSVLIALTFLAGRAVLGVLALRFRTRTTRERVERADVPPGVAELLERESGPLEALGFEPLCFTRTQSAVAGSDQPFWARLFQHPVEKSFAALAPSLAPSPTRRCEVAFLAQADAGRELRTVPSDTERLHRDCPKHVRVSAGTRDPAGMWERHQREVAERPDFAPRDVSVDELLVENEQVFACVVRSGIDSGLLTPAGEGAARYTVRAALGIAFRSLLERRRRRPAAAAKDVEAPADPATPGDVTAEVLAHKRRESISAVSSHGWLVKLGLFAASMAAMMVAFGLTLSLRTAVIVIGVLLVHESGHALAMKLFGYRNLQMLFIPLFGAVASGHKRDVRPWQELVVLLAGPLPGIAVGLGLYFFAPPDAPDWLADTTSVLLMLNYFNLLPVHPLDGGQIMNVILFERFPRAQVAFAGLSAVALIFVSGGRMIFLLGVAMLLTLPSQLKQARLLNRARAKLAEQPVPDGVDPLPLLYGELQREKMPADAKFELVKELVQRLARRPAGVGLACASFAGWLLLMALPLGVIRYKAVSEGEQAVARFQVEHQKLVATWTAKIAAAATPQEEVGARVGAAQELLEHFDAGEARRALEPSFTLFRKVDAPELEATAHLLMASLELGSDEDAPAGPEATARAERHLLRALDLREQRFGVESPQVAEVLEAFPADDPNDRVGALVRTLRLIAIYERAETPNAGRQLVQAYQREAELRDERGDAARAEAALRQAIASAEKLRDSEQRALREQARDELAGFYFAHARWDELRPLVESGSADACWMAYWDGKDDAAGCFAALRAKPAKSAGGRLRADWRKVELLVDEATAEVRAGDAGAARPLVAEASKSYGDLLEGADLGLYLRTASASPRGTGFRVREMDRRAAERARALEPFLTSAADARE